MGDEKLVEETRVAGVTASALFLSHAGSFKSSSGSNNSLRPSSNTTEQQLISFLLPPSSLYLLALPSRHLLVPLSGAPKLSDCLGLGRALRQSLGS